MITILQNKRFLVLVGILALVVSYHLTRNPNQNGEDTTESSQKTTKVTLTNWEKYDSSIRLLQGYTYPTYSINIPDALYLRAENIVNPGRYNSEDKRITTSWSSNPNTDPDKLKDGLFVTVDVEMNPKTSKDNPFTREDYKSEIATDCEGAPEIWNFAGLRAAKYICDSLSTSAGKSAAIASYSVLKDGKLFTVKAASLDTSIVSLMDLEQIIDRFRFVQEIDKTPKIEGNTITITVTNPYYGPNKEGYALFYDFTLSYDRRSDDAIQPSEFGQGITITRAPARLSIGFGFEDGQVIYEKIPNVVIISNPKLSNAPIYRLTSIVEAYTNQPPIPLDYYRYVSQYQENKPAMVGSNSCGESVDPVAACSMGSVSGKDSIIGLSCNADSDSVYNCDDIVKSLTVRKVGLD